MRFLPSNISHIVRLVSKRPRNTHTKVNIQQPNGALRDVQKFLHVCDKMSDQDSGPMTGQNPEFYTGNIEALKIEKSKWHNI